MTRKVVEDDLLRGAGGNDPENLEGVPIRPISEAGLGRMIRQRQHLTNQAAETVREIESLRQRQSQLEKEKSDIETLRGKQEEYERGKRDIMDRLAKSVVYLDKEQARATRAAELLAAVRARFKEVLAGLRGINESGWSEETFEVEMDRAIALVDDARGVFRKGMSKVEAGSWHKTGTDEAGAGGVVEFPPELRDGRVFGYWMKVGVAVSLPLIVVILALFAVWAVLIRIF